MNNHPLRIVLAISTLMCVMLLASCGSSTAAVAGTYDLDKEAIKAAAAEQAEEGPGAAMMAGMIDAMVMTLTLNADGTASMHTSVMGQSNTGTGTWSLDGKTITLEVAKEGGVSEQVTGTVDGDTITLNNDEEDTPFDIVFRKKA